MTQRWFVDVSLVFFFQAEDGIRDVAVTGVQTCALPICRAQKLGAAGLRVGAATERQDRSLLKLASAADCRAKLVRFELAEECLAEALEDLRDGEAARLFDALVEIEIGRAHV